MNKLKVHTNIRLECRDKNGETKWVDNIHNLVVNAGLAGIAGLVGDTGSVDPFTYIAVGSSNTAVAAGQTALQSEISTSGLGRAAATVSRTTTTATNDTLRLEKTFSASGSETVEEVGIFNDASAGTMLGRALTGSKSVDNGDDLVVTYDIVFTAS